MPALQPLLDHKIPHSFKFEEKLQHIQLGENLTLRRIKTNSRRELGTPHPKTNSQYADILVLLLKI